MWHNVCIIENKILSIWQLRYHWWYRILSLQQLTVPSVITKISNWQSFVYRDWAQDWAQKNLSMIERLFYWQVYCHQRHWWQSRWQNLFSPLIKPERATLAPCWIAIWLQDVGFPRQTKHHIKQELLINIFEYAFGNSTSCIYLPD